MIVRNKNQICFVWKICAAILASFLMVLVFPMHTRAAEATICHQHTSECYQEKAITCTDINVVSTHNEDFQCATCGRVSSARVVVETYTCEHSDYKREYRRIAYCYGCGGVVQNKQTSAVLTHVRITKVCVCEMTEETVIAKVKFTPSTCDWTNGEVVLNATVEEAASGQSLAPYTYAFSQGSVNGTSCTVSENGTYSVTVTASNGQQTVASLQINNIDKEAPVIHKVYVDKTYPEYSAANLIVEAEDGQSGLEDSAYSFDGGKTYVNSYSYPVYANGSYTVWVKDRAGNCSTQSISVTCFAKRAQTENSSQTTTTQNGKTQNEKTQNSVSTTNAVSKKGSKIENSGMEGSEMENSQNSIFQSGEVDIEERRALLKEKLENSEYAVSLENIPGVYSSLMRQTAEKNAVPMTLNVVSERNESAYSGGEDLQENLVKNISISEENVQSKGTFAQVSKGVVATGVLLCIGMAAFLIVFLVKKQ